MDAGSGTKAPRMLQSIKIGSRPFSPKGREGSPSPYDFCNTGRSDEEDDELHSELDEGSSRGRRQYQREDSFSDGDSSVRSASGREPPTESNYLNLEKGVHHEHLGVQSEYSEGTDEGAYANSFYGPLYQKSISSEQEDAPLDIENNILIWDPPPPEDEVDEMAIDMGDDDDNDTKSFWSSTQSFGSMSSSEYKTREKAATDEQRQAIREVVSGHFRVLVAQLLHGEGIQTDEACQQSWLEIVTALSLEAANFVKPDTSRSGGMDPGGYVKVKYVATGKPDESQVVKGIVCKKNVAHRRMKSHYKSPKILLLGGALEFQEHFASLRTMLQQETDHLSMAVARIEACHPNVLMVEKNVYRKAQEQLLTKEISLVLNVKRPLLERIARCTGGSVIPGVDHLSAKSTQLGLCEIFHVEKYLEEHDRTGQDGKKPTKTLMFFEGCPKPLGCTILLKGANSEELRKVKRAVQFAVFAAYHLARETSFLVDEGVNLPELCLKAPLSVALPDKKSKSDMSISTVSGFLTPTSSQLKSVVHVGGLPSANSLTSVLSKETPSLSAGDRFLRVPSQSGLLALSGNSSFASSRPTSPLSSPFSRQETFNHAEGAKPWMTGSNSLLRDLYGATLGKLSLAMTPEDVRKGYLEAKALDLPMPRIFLDDGAVNTDLNSHFGTSETSPKSPLRLVVSSPLEPQDRGQYLLLEESSLAELDSELHTNSQDEEGQEYLREDFPPSPSDHQSILVSFSSSCLRKGIVCQRGHLFRIKYYGTFDNPLGRFLRDTVFDLTKKCSSCGEAKDAHVDCYTHRQGSLTISVHKQNQVLPGESEGKIWMWHRCLKCARIKGMPPTTRRLVMSDAAWGLSFGKFLELSFSNHAAASRVASCGHSLHRDCLRFYGFSRLVACFRYSPVNVYSVYLPPSKLEFHYSEHQDWLQQEIQEIAEKGELCFKDVFDHLHEINEKANGYNSGKALEAKRRVAEMECLAIKQKAMFKAALHCAASASSRRKDQPHIDILQLNYIRRCLYKCSSTWSRCLQRCLPSLKPLKADTGVDLLGDSLILSLQDVSFGIGRSCKSDDSYEALTTKDWSLDSSSSELYQGRLPIPNSIEELASGGGLGSPSKVKMSDSVNGFEVASFSDAVASTRSSGSSTLSSEVASDVDPMARGGDNGITRTMSEGRQFSTFGDLSATFDAAWTGQGHGSFDEGSSHKSADETWVSSEESENGSKKSSPEAVDGHSFRPRKLLSVHESGATGFEPQFSSTLMSPAKAGEPSDIEGWVGEPYSKLCRPFGESTSLSASGSSPAEDTLVSPVSPFGAPQVGRVAMQEEARMCFPVGIDDAMVSVHDDEPTSVIAFALTSQEHKAHVTDTFNRSVSDLFELSERSSEPGDRDKPSVSEEGSHPRAHDSLPDDPLLYSKAMHMKVNFTDDGPQGKVRYTVTCYYAKQFDGLRRKCCPNAVDFIRSLCRCKKWGAQGGKSNVFFAKTVDDRFVVKQVTRTELDSFMTFAPAYFKYIYEALISGSPTCLAKILGIYQVVVKHGKVGKEVRMDLMIMENLLYGRHVTRVYDLKGSLRSRYNSDVTGKDAVLLDQNLLESMQTNPIFISNKSKRLLERAVWNDTAFLASVDVMDYSLLVGIDEERKDLVLGIIDFMRQYTWDKHLETWVKASGILGGPKNATPTIISPMQYKKRFRKAMSTYFLMVPDQWSPLTVRADLPLIEPADENSSATVQDGGAMDEFDTI